MSPAKCAPSSWIRPFADLLFPRSCQLCDKQIVEPDREAICSICIAELKPPKHHCLRCSAPTPPGNAVAPKSCPLCKKEWRFRNAYSLCTYRASAAKAARKMKSAHTSSLTEEIGRRLGEWFLPIATENEYDVCVPIPQHWYRRWVERYNQAEILAQAVAKTLNTPMHPRLLYRTKWAEKQGTKTIEERLRNMNGVIANHGRPCLKNKRVLVIDDILTSGATASDAARSLRQAGAKLVDVLTFARGASSLSK